MSDGPHRSLPMRRAWKRVAEWADNPAFKGEEVCKAIISALERDCRGEMSTEFLTRLSDVCNGQAISLFKNPLGLELETLRGDAGCGIGRVVLEFAIQVSDGEVSGADIPSRAVMDALTDRAARNARQVEEHYCRESTVRRAGRVRERIERGADRASVEGLARGILKREPGRLDRPSIKHEGLDDGVRLG